MATHSHPHSPPACVGDIQSRPEPNPARAARVRGGRSRGRQVEHAAHGRHGQAVADGEDTSIDGLGEGQSRVAPGLSAVTASRPPTVHRRLRLERARAGPHDGVGGRGSAPLLGRRHRLPAAGGSGCGPGILRYGGRGMVEGGGVMSGGWCAGAMSGGGCEVTSGMSRSAFHLLGSSTIFAGGVSCVCAALLDIWMLATAPVDLLYRVRARLPRPC